MRLKFPLSIFGYVDYRFFLADFFNLQKKIPCGFTFRSFARKAGLSASLLKDILSKRQNLTLPTMRKYAGAMGLGVKETAYFEALVGFNNAATNSEKNSFFGKMVRLRGRAAAKTVDILQYEYFSEWYHTVVRELMTHVGLGCDPATIARRIVPAVSPAKIRRSITLLKELGLVHQGSDGARRVSDRAIPSEYEIRSLALKNYHTGMLERSAEALEKYPISEREFQGLTISTSRTTFLRMKERIRSFTNELTDMAAAEKEKTGEVYQINVHMFPFTRSNTS
jgi:uncharacterized protein (TIGR02147 family)